MNEFKNQIMMKCGHAANATCSHKNGEKFDPPIPSCVICDCTEQFEGVPWDIELREAKCSTCGAIKESDFYLPFFEYCGPGSKSAEEICGNCRYTKNTHSEETLIHGARKVDCENFKPQGDIGHDRYYCGCRGWE